jgi:glucose-6-phosphate isomerase
MAKTLYSQHFKNISFSKKNSSIKKNVQSCAKFLRQQIMNKEIKSIDVVFNQKDLKEFEILAKKISGYKKVLVLGVGGSSLGGKTLSALKDQNKVDFLESIDPTSVKNSLAKINFEETFFLVISKSGETIETICQTLIILDQIKKKKIKNFANQFLFVTQSLNNSLAKIAQEINAKIANHPEEIGGRYSCFSIVGMLPALIAGIDIKKIRLGAQKIINDFLETSEIENSCTIQLELYEKGFNGNVIMPYIDSLKDFTDWYRQLWAESLGKNGFGSTPINSMGTVDQHSQLQLYLEGPKNKFFTFITQNNPIDDFDIKDIANCPTLFGKKKLSQIVEIEQNTTIEVLNQKKLPIRIFELGEIKEEVLGGLMMQMFLETILISYVKEINPFDQPAVELRKDLAKKLLKKNVK